MYLWAICNKKIQERGRAEKNLENMTMSLTAIEYQIYSYVKNTYMIIVYSLSIYDKRLFQLIWQGSGASNSEINIFILIFFIFAQWPVLMYNPCIVLSMNLNRIVNLLTLTRANFDLGNSLTFFEKVHVLKSCGKVFLLL